MEKQVLQVWEAIRRGADTSVEIAEMTGLSVGHVCNYLPDLVSVGLVKRTGRFKRGPRGHFMQCYEPACWGTDS